MNADEIKSKVEESAKALKSKLPSVPKVALVLGSGLGPYGEQLLDAETVDYTEVPHFPKPKVSGHAGKLVYGKIPGSDGTEVLIMQGRVHYYEGHDMNQVVHPVRTLCKLGVEKIVITNAAGGIDSSFAPGNLMMITDHINFFGDNPLRGPNLDGWGERFPDMGDAYGSEDRKHFFEAAADIGIDLKQGVYVGLSGPCYETPAEVKMLRTLGGSAVGMSTVPEVIAAHHMGVDTFGISCITNLAADLSQEVLNHSDVEETSKKALDKFTALLNHAIPKL